MSRFNSRLFQFPVSCSAVTLLGDTDVVDADAEVLATVVEFCWGRCDVLIATALGIGCTTSELVARNAGMAYPLLGTVEVLAEASCV